MSKNYKKMYYYNIIFIYKNNVKIAFKTYSDLIKPINEKMYFTKISQAYNYDCSGV